VKLALLGLLSAVLLWLEWRYRLRSLRIGAVVLAIVVWESSQPNLYRVFRWVIAAPPAERVSRMADGPPLSEYASGVVTLQRAYVEEMMVGENERLLSLGILVWLACSPAFRRAGVQSAGDVSPRQPQERAG
jgi:hypothetical protein